MTSTVFHQSNKYTLTVKTVMLRQVENTLTLYWKLYCKSYFWLHTHVRTHTQALYTLKITLTGTKLNVMGFQTNQIIKNLIKHILVLLLSFPMNKRYKAKRADSNIQSYQMVSLLTEGSVYDLFSVKTQ